MKKMILALTTLLTLSSSMAFAKDIALTCYSNQMSASQGYNTYMTVNFTKKNVVIWDTHVQTFQITKDEKRPTKLKNVLLEDGFALANFGTDGSIEINLGNLQGEIKVSNEKVFVDCE